MVYYNSPDIITNDTNILHSLVTSVSLQDARQGQYSVIINVVLLCILCVVLSTYSNLFPSPTGPSNAWHVVSPGSATESGRLPW